MDLKQLIHECKHNNRKSQEQLYRIYAPKLFAICLKYSRNYEEAQDNFQEGFLLIFEKVNTYSFKGSFEGWMKRVMINYVLQQYRKETFLNLVPEKEDTTTEIELEDDQISMDYLLKIIQELPDRYRLIFNLYVMDGYSHIEIAEMANITVGTSKSNLARAKMILKTKIEQYKTTINTNFPSAK